MEEVKELIKQINFAVGYDLFGLDLDGIGLVRLEEGEKVEASLSMLLATASDLLKKAYNQ